VLTRTHAEDHALGEKAPQRPERLVMEIAGDTRAFVSEAGGSRQTLGEFSRANGEAAIARLAEAGQLVRGKADIVLRFATDFVLRPEMRLPKASGRVLRAALAFELERVSPVPPAELYFDHVVTHYDLPTNRVSLHVRAVRRNDFDQIRNLCHNLGLSVSAVTFESDARPGSLRTFPLDRSAVARALWRTAGVATLAVLAFVLLIAIAFATAARWSAAGDALSGAVANESIRAAAVERLVHRIDSTKAQIAYVLQRRSAPRFVETLAALSDVLPDDSWVDEISVTGAKLHIQGYSQAAAQLIARFDRSGAFANAQFTAPLVRSATNNTERFELSADIARKSQR
jgi:general secretion pathway protein L